jgi:diguanylate cyclase (GGDEF)-like protein/PAS domain S-box-containing protein
LTDPDLPIEVSLTGIDALGAVGEPFYGPDLSDDPRAVSTIVNLPNGSWLMRARPKGGWEAAMPQTSQLRVWMILGGLLIFIPSAYSGFLMRHTRRQNKILAEREKRLALVTERLNVALGSSNIGVWEANLVTGERYWDERTNKLFGYEDFQGARPENAFSDALHPDDKERVEKSFNRAISEKSQLNAEFRIVLPNGRIRHLQSRCAYYHENGEDPRMVGVNWDVTEEVRMKDDLLAAKQLAESKNVELEQMQQRIRHLALHDPLTGLPNRRYLDQSVAEYQRANGGKHSIAMLALDLDRFKQINDTLGHRAGDMTLKHVAQVLREKVDEKDFIARVGGDEFVIIVERLCDKSELATMAADIITSLKEPLVFEGHTCRFGASVGVAISDPSKPDMNDLLVKADIALYRAKEMGRNCFEFFSDDQQARILKARQDSEEILWGLELGQFVPFYQPQFDAKSGRIVGVEALARWDHPDKGVLGPFEFLKVAEDINVIDDIDHDILATVLTDMKNWEELGFDVGHASVNVSSPRLRDENLIRRLADLDIEPNKITFELLESIFLDEHDDVIEQNLAAIRDMGIDIDIDDFGTGHASIVGLLKLQPTRIKIDRQFVTSLEQSDEQRRLTKSIIDMGKSLGIEVLAEGVETQAQADILRTLGVDTFQGYLYAKPMSASDMKRFMINWQAQAS